MPPVRCCPNRRWLAVAVACAAMLGATACAEAARLVRIAPQLLAPSGGTQALLPFTGVEPAQPRA